MEGEQNNGGSESREGCDEFCIEKYQVFDIPGSLTCESEATKHLGQGCGLDGHQHARDCPGRVRSARKIGRENPTSG